MSTKTIHWFTFPKSVIEASKRAGISRVVTQIALRDLTGDDHEQAMTRALTGASGSGRDAVARVAGNIGTTFRRRMLIQSIVAVSFDPECKPESQKECSEASPDPDFIPENIFVSLHTKAVGLVERAFSKINDGTEEEDASFFESQRTVTTGESPQK